MHSAFQRRAAGIVQQLSKLQLRRQLTGKFGIKTHAGQRIMQLLYPFGVRQLMHTVDKRNLHFLSHPRGTGVGQQHKLFNHLLGNAALDLFNVDSPAIFVQHNLCFAGFNLHTATGCTALRQLFI